MTTQQTSSGIQQTVFGIMTEIQFTYLTKKTISYCISLTVISLFFFILIPSVSSISITEVELNPLGSDAGNEWIEIYSSESISLEGYYLANEDGDIYNLNGTLNNYQVIQFPKQWLDNSQAIIKIKKDNSTIYETPELADSKNNDLTFSLCNGEYKLIESSKGIENKCNSDNANTESNNNSNYSNSNNTNINPDTQVQTNDAPEENKTLISGNVVKISNEQTITQNTYQANESNKIFLNQDNKEKVITYTSKEDKTRLYIVYAFTFLCVLIIILLALRKL